MNRELLYRYLETKLSDEGFASEQIDKRMNRFKEKYAAMTDGEVTADVEQFGGPEKMAESVIAELRIPRPAKKKEPLASQIPDSVLHSDVQKKPAEQASTESDAFATKMVKLSAEQSAEAEKTISIDAGTIRKISHQSEEIMAVTPEEAEEIEQTAETKVVTNGRRKSRIHTALYDKISWEKGSPEAEERFKKKFRALSPLWILGLLVTALMLGIVFLLLILLIPVFILLLIACVAAGVGVSLVGIIFGISKLFSSVPIGLDNIGLGIVAAGITLMLGVLIYNCAIRLCPYLIVRMKFVFQYVSCFFEDLYYYWKGESVKK